MIKDLMAYNAAYLHIYNNKELFKKLENITSGNQGPGNIYGMENEGVIAYVIFRFGFNNSICWILNKKNKDIPPLVFPLLRNDNQAKVKLNKITVNKYETTAVLEGTVFEEVLISFFDPFYFINKKQYHIGKYYKFNICALSYSLKKAIYSRNDEIEMKGMKIYIPNENRKDNFTFTFPYDPTLTSTTKFNEFDLTIFQYSLPTTKEHYSVPFNLVMNSKDFDKVSPKKGEDIIGNAWLQGFLSDTFELNQNRV